MPDYIGCACIVCEYKSRSGPLGCGRFDSPIKISSAAPGRLGLAVPLRKRKYLNEMTYLFVDFGNLAETDALPGKYSSIERQHSIWR